MWSIADFDHENIIGFEAPPSFPPSLTLSTIIQEAILTLIPAIFLCLCVLACVRAFCVLCVCVALCVYACVALGVCGSACTCVWLLVYVALCVYVCESVYVNV